MNGFVLVIALVVLSSAARADNLPCPPKYYFCWQAKVVFSKYGTARVVAKAKACGWNAAEIAEAVKCKGE